MQIRNTNDSEKQFKSYLVFGQTKTGKTKLASTLPKDKTLIVNTENNLDSLYGAGMNVVDCYTYDDFIEILDIIQAWDQKPGWLYIDSISDLMNKVFVDTFKKLKDGRQAYTEFERQYNYIISRFKSLPCNIVAIGRQAQIKDEITGGLIFGTALPWARLQCDLPYNFSSVFATRVSKGQDGADHYAIQCRPCSQYQVGTRLEYGKENSLSQFEEPDLLAIHNKIVN